MTRVTRAELTSGEAIGLSGDLYVLFGLSSAVFGYGGWPFLEGFVRRSHMSNSTTNTNTVLIIIGTVIVVLLLVLVFSGGMMPGSMMDGWR